MNALGTGRNSKYTLEAGSYKDRNVKKQKYKVSDLETNVKLKSLK